MSKSVLRQCYTCKEFKELGLFVKNKRKSLGHAYKCKSCHNKVRRVRGRLRRYVGDGSSKIIVLPETIRDFAEAQGHACAICKVPESLGNTLCVDHCHTSSKLRGLLCRSCNTGLGHFRDDPALLAQAISYLKRNL